MIRRLSLCSSHSSPATSLGLVWSCLDDTGTSGMLHFIMTWTSRIHRQVNTQIQSVNYSNDRQKLCSFTNLFISCVHYLSCSLILQCSFQIREVHFILLYYQFWEQRQTYWANVNYLLFYELVLLEKSLKMDVIVNSTPSLRMRTISSNNIDDKSNEIKQCPSRMSESTKKMLPPNSYTVQTKPFPIYGELSVNNFILHYNYICIVS